MIGGNHAVGVDFGTSTSLLAERIGALPVEIASLGRSTRWFPSLAGQAAGTLLVGEDAETLPSNQVIRSIKRAVTENRDVVEVAGPDGPLRARVDDVIIALLSEIGRRAAAADHPLTAEGDLRLGCPAMWDGRQRQRLLDLATKAGLPVDASALIDEPIAAGVAWVTHRFLAYGERPAGRLLVFDMGGGTLDIAVLDVEGGEQPEITVLSALGVGQAGDALDQAIAAELTAALAGHGFDVDDQHEPDVVRSYLLRAAREAKVRLSQVQTHAIVLSRRLGNLPVLYYDREQLEDAFGSQMDSAEQLIWAALRGALHTERGDRSPDQLRALGQAELARNVDYVLLAGGMSRIPYVERRIGALFPGAQVFDNAGVEPDEAIVAGLADTSGYDRLNLHRPGFDFILEWSDGGQPERQTIYPAYTPFYEPWQVLQGQSHLGYEWRARNLPGRWQGEGVLQVRSTSGQRLTLDFDGKRMDGFQLRLGRNMMVKLYCDGRILIRDGAGQAFHLRVYRWPVMRGRDHARLMLRSEEERPATAPTPWYHEKEWAPPSWQARPR
ncbi:Hsp70 family protein [Plantactinospora sp. B6F1]|uniref:Hsp70 family protein n=1 Tax=Plantactinospora sp. B6F1 TaxID=3158971 RepID=UPI0032D8D3ED